MKMINASFALRNRPYYFFAYLGLLIAEVEFHILFVLFVCSKNVEELTNLRSDLD